MRAEAAAEGIGGMMGACGVQSVQSVPGGAGGLGGGGDLVRRRAPHNVTPSFSCASSGAAAPPGGTCVDVHPVVVLAGGAVAAPRPAWFFQALGSIRNFGTPWRPHLSLPWARPLRPSAIGQRKVSCGTMIPSRCFQQAVTSQSLYSRCHPRTHSCIDSGRRGASSGICRGK